METLIFEIETENDPRLEEAARILREGGTVIFPTETVYGLGADALSVEAVRQIYVAKGRPSDNPIIIHIAQWSQIFDIAAVVSPEAEKLAEAFWPGPLTMILPKSEAVPDTVTGGLKTVAIRLPAHPIARKLIALAGVPVAAPSANLSGKPSPTSAAHVLQDMAGRVDCILCGGDSSGGVESTVVDLTVSPPMILRPGGVTLEQLRHVIPDIRMDLGLTEIQSNQAPRSPGMKYAHYAPNAPMTLYVGPAEQVRGAMQAAVREAMTKGLRVAVLSVVEHEEWYKNSGAAFYSLGSGNKAEEAAQFLFQRLRECNADDVDLILAEGVPEQGIGRAVMNRMRKAAANHVISVQARRSPLRVLIVCSGNTCRSPMAEVILLEELDRAGMSDIEVRSAGLASPGGEAMSPYSAQVLERAGYSGFEGFRSTDINSLALSDFDRILCMTRNQMDVLNRLSPAIAKKTRTLALADDSSSADIRDPFGGPTESYLKTFEEIHDAVMKLVVELKEENKRS